MTEHKTAGTPLLKYTRFSSLAQSLGSWCRFTLSTNKSNCWKFQTMISTSQHWHMGCIIHGCFLIKLSIRLAKNSWNMSPLKMRYTKSDLTEASKHHLDVAPLNRLEMWCINNWNLKLSPHHQYPIDNNIWFCLARQWHYAFCKTNFL